MSADDPAPAPPSAVAPGSTLAVDPPPWAPSDPDPGPVRLPVRVRFLECDPQGVLAHPRYLDLFDDVYMRLNATRFGGFASMMAGGVETLVVRCELGFTASSRAEDRLELILDLARLGTSSVTLRYRALGAEAHDLRATAHTTYVCTRVGEHRSAPIPRWMRERYRALGSAGDDEPDGDQPSRP